MKVKISTYVLCMLFVVYALWNGFCREQLETEEASIDGLEQKLDKVLKACSVMIDSGKTYMTHRGWELLGLFFYFALFTYIATTWSDSELYSVSSTKYCLRVRRPRWRGGRVSDGHARVAGSRPAAGQMFARSANMYLFQVWILWYHGTHSFGYVPTARNPSEGSGLCMLLYGVYLFIGTW